jgi:hypothetical protein
MSEENLLPEEMSDQGQAIVQDLRHLYNTALEDQQSLARIRARFLQKSASELPIAAISAEEPLSIIEQTTSHKTGKSSLAQKWQAQQPWIRRLNLLAALLLAAVLVGSLVLILAQSRQTNVSSTLFRTPFQSQSGWHTMFSYSGTGSKTITDLSITLPQLYKLRVNCVGGDKVDVSLESMGYKNATGLDPCTNELYSRPSPTSYSYDLVSRPIHTITVTAQSQTTWYLQIDRADTQPNFTLQPFWHELAAMGGTTTTSFTSTGQSNPDAKTWGIVIMCQGHGSGAIQFTPDIGNIQVTSCSMQPTLLVVHYPYKTAVTKVTITIIKSAWFDMHLLSCQDDVQCRLLPSAPISKS